MMYRQPTVTAIYQLAKERYDLLGVDIDRAISQNFGFYQGLGYWAFKNKLSKLVDDLRVTVFPKREVILDRLLSVYLRTKMGGIHCSENRDFVKTLRSLLFYVNL